jgi:hypothetical protein
MGTRSETVIYDSYDPTKVLVKVYRQMDGYPSSQGVDLATLCNVRIVNGLSGPEDVANGMGCLAARIIRGLKSGPGGIYIQRPDVPADEEYVYEVRGEVGGLPTIKCIHGEETLFELPADKALEWFTVTDPSVPLWMISTEGKPAFMYDKFFLLIDEYGQGEADVKRAVAEIFLNGGTRRGICPPGSCAHRLHQPRCALRRVEGLRLLHRPRALLEHRGRHRDTLRYMPTSPTPSGQAVADHAGREGVGAGQPADRVRGRAQGAGTVVQPAAAVRRRPLPADEVGAAGQQDIEPTR